MKRLIYACIAVAAGLTAGIAEELRPTEQPVDRLSWKDNRGRFWWKEMYDEQMDCVRKCGGKLDFVLVGDSITRNWAADKGRSYFGGDRLLGRVVASEMLSDYNWLNAGIGGDGTSQVLWRCQNGVLDGYETKLVSLMVGTNNRRDSAEDVARGIARIVAVIREKQPKAKLLLSPILPRFPREDDPGDMNAKNEKTNEIIRRLCDGENVIWFDWRKGLYKGAELDKDLWYDREHPAEGGYRVWAKALLPYVREAVGPEAAARLGVELTPPGGGTLRFGGANRAFSCIGFDFGKYRFVDWSREPTGLWKLSFRAGPAGEEKVLDALSFRNGTAVRTDTGVKFVWKGLDLDAGDGAVDVACAVDWKSDRRHYEFRIQVRNRSAKYGLFDTEFPRLSNVIRKDEGSIIHPGGNWGGCRLRMNWPRKSVYPDYDVPVQLMMFEPDCGGGMMLFAQDDGPSVKYLKSDDKFSCSFLVPAEDAGVPGKAGAPRFTFALYPYAGDTWQAAKHYREWAKGASWLAKGPIAARTDFSPRVRNGGLWLLVTSKESISNSEAAVNRALDRVKGRVPISVHWYCWHKHPFDTLYPNYFPEKDGFADAVKRLTAKGVQIMPYINGRLWDQADPEFERVKTYACYQTNGVPYVETWNKRNFSAMCQGTAFWRDLMVGVADRLIDKCGVNSIYYDQIASMKSVVCYAGHHGHTVGGGNHWVDGYCRLVQAARDRHPSVSFTSENFSEPYIGVFEGFLTWSPNMDSDVPLLPAIYSGYCTTFACRTNPNYTMEAFRAAQGRTFLWGGQGGWEQEWILLDHYAAKFDFLVKLAEIRGGALEFFSDGELLGEVKNLAEAPTLALKWERWGKPIDVKFPAVQATLWRAPSGAELVAIVNYSDKPQTFDGGTACPRQELAPGEVKLVRK